MFLDVIGGLIRHATAPLDELQAEQDGYQHDNDNDNDPSPELRGRLKAAFERGRADRDARGA